MKERVTLTIDRDILKRVDSQIDQETVKNRSHAVELLLRKVLRGRVPKTAVILAGGTADKLKPLTEKRPKPMLDIQGRPLMEHNIELLKRFGVQEVIISIGPMGDQIKKHFGDGKEHGVAISYVEEKTPMGTAGALRLVKDRLTEPFIVINADELKDISLSKLFDVHNQSQATATIALTTVEDPSEYGVAMLDGNRIQRFVEKPSKEDAPSKLINAGLYILEPEAISLIPEGFAMFETNVFPILAREGKLVGYPFSGQWFDTRSVERLEDAGKRWKGLTK